MFRICLTFMLLVLANVTQCPSTIAAPQSELPTLEQCHEIIDASLPTIVQFNYDAFGNGQIHLGCGVIVSPDGHVVVSGPVAAVLDNKLLELRLSDGRQVSGEALGWSSEFGFGVLKITEPGDWPFVKLSEEVQVGETCLAWGYNRQHFGEPDLEKSRPESRLSVVTRVSKGVWFTTSHQSEFSGHPVFNMNGELLGLCVRSRFGDDAIHNSATAIGEHWKELAAGRNLDRKRLLDETKPTQTYGKLPEKISEETLAKIKAASVQIGDVGEKPFFSGVIIPDSYVITCAHHDRLPGAELMITVSDGRSAKAVVAGTDWITDVCVLKITDEGMWPFVNLGFSSVLTEAAPVVLIGYPILNDQKPLVLMSHVIEPKYGLKRRDPWSHTLYAACDVEQAAIALKGASGGGIFDSSGNVVGVLSSVVDDEVYCARVELFHKNWAGLTTKSTIEEIAPEVRESIAPGLKKLMFELTNPAP